MIMEGKALVPVRENSVDNVGERVYLWNKSPQEHGKIAWSSNTSINFTMSLKYRILIPLLTVKAYDSVSNTCCNN
jgi:hypothetical protein